MPAEGCSIACGSFVASVFAIKEQLFISILEFHNKADPVPEYPEKIQLRIFTPPTGSNWPQLLNVAE